MSTLWFLTRKNLQLLIRAKSSALIVVFAPLLIILILGLSFNNSAKYGLNIGIYSSTFTEDVESFVSTLKESEFKIVKYSTSVQDCVEDLKLGFVHTCIAVPETFKIESNAPREVTFYVDPSRVNLVWMVQETLQKKFNLKAQELSQELARDLLARLLDTKTKVEEEKSTLAAAQEKSQAAASSTDVATSTLTTIDVAAPETVYDLAVVGAFKDGLDAALLESKNKVAAAKTAVNDANLNSSEKSKIKTFLTAAETQVGSAQDLLGGNATGSGSFTAVSSLVEALNADLASAKSKLAAAGEKVSSASSSVLEVKAAVGQSLASLDQAQQNLNAIQELLNAQKVTEAKVISNPLITNIERVTAEGTYLNYLFSGLLVLVVMFSSLLLGTTLVMMEKNSPAFLRNFFVPVKKVTFILSTYLTNLILILIQVVIILTISFIFIPSSITSLPPMALVLFLAASVFTFLGMAIGYLFTSEETGVLASISTGSLLLFVSGLILPLESMPPLFRAITSFNPFVIAERLIREIFIFEAPFSALQLDVLILFGYAVVLFLIILIIESVLHQQLADKLTRHHRKIHEEKGVR